MQACEGWGKNISQRAVKYNATSVKGDGVTEKHKTFRASTEIHSRTRYGFYRRSTHRRKYGRPDYPSSSTNAHTLYPRGLLRMPPQRGDRGDVQV